MAFTEDLGAFFSDFAEAVTIGGTPGVAIFDDGFRSVLDDGIATTGPALTIQQSDFPPSLVGAAVVVRQTSYSVVGVEPDGTGVAVLRLERL